MKDKKFTNLLLRFIGFVMIALSPMMTAPAAAEDFTMIVLPDTQYYSETYPAIFKGQTQWIVDNKDALNIVYVAHEGDIVNNASASQSYQWKNADAAMSLLEDPVSTSLPDGIPYGISPGNNDHWPELDPDGTQLYNQYFGKTRFSGRGYYGGHFGADNDNHFSLFSAGGLDFIVIDLDFYGVFSELDWADSLLKTYSDRRAIVVSHYIMDNGEQAPFGYQGQLIYDALKDNPNLFLMLCGHQRGEGKRVDRFKGNTIYTLLADYQGRDNGGNGWLRILEFSPESNKIRIKTYSPHLDQYETDADSQFTLSYDMTQQAPEINLKHGVTDIPSGTGSYDFGTVNLGSDTTMAFTIENLGDASLELTGDPKIELGGKHVRDFNVVAQPSSLIAPSSSVTFDIEFSPSATGARTASVSIANNDSDEHPYTFTVTGNGTCSSSPDVVTLTTPSGNISDATPTYSWDEGPCATWYYLWVNGPAGTPVIQQWYKAPAVCSGGDCSVTLETELPDGDYTWWIRTWNSYGHGSWSAGMTFTVQAPPPAATPILPFGTVGDTTPTYIWSEVPGATWYHLWVNNAAGTPVIRQWYTSAQANGGGGSCAVTPSTTLANDNYTWWVQTWNSNGFGPWSAGKPFTVRGCTPGKTVLITPSGSSTNPPRNYWWYEVDNANWYYLWVNGPSGNVIRQWYTSAQANCNGKWCWVTNTTALPAGTNTWWIRTWNSSCGDGPWSAGKRFTVPATLRPPN